MKDYIVGLGYTDVSDVKDRGYFFSVYLRTPGGALFELAYSTPQGFTIDEAADELGTHMCIPPHWEDRRVGDRLSSSRSTRSRRSSRRLEGKVALITDPAGPPRHADEIAAAVLYLRLRRERDGHVPYARSRRRDERIAHPRPAHAGAPSVVRWWHAVAAPYAAVMPVEVTLTFDNGPDPEATPHVLDVLAARDLKATFFVVGERLAAARHLAERAHAEGHWIGNHTWTHRAPFGELEDSCARMRRSSARRR